MKSKSLASGDSDQEEILIFVSLLFFTVADQGDAPSLFRILTSVCWIVFDILLQQASYYSLLSSGRFLSSNLNILVFLLSKNLQIVLNRPLFCFPFCSFSH